MGSFDLQRFCACEHDVRDYLRKPWAHKGYLYATNGHICVRAPAPEHAGTVFDNKIAEGAAGLFDRATNTDYAPLPEFAPAPECTFCSGAARLKMIACEDCDGEGFFNHGQHEYQCKECDGEGWLTGSGELRDCPQCYGTGQRSSFVRLAPRIGYDARYLAWIKDLPGARFSIGEAAHIGARVLAGHFIFTGGEGLLMPMTDPPDFGGA